MSRHRIIGLSLLVGVIAGVAVFGLVVRARVTVALAATQRVQAAVARRDPHASCAELESAAAAWQRVASLSGPATPLLHWLGWVPQIGSDLRIAPDMIALAQHATAAGTIACDTLQPALDATTTSQRLLIVAQQLQAHPAELAALQTHVRAAQVAWQAAAPFADSSQRIAPYRSYLQTLDASLPAAITGLDAASDVAPQISWLLGADAPRRLLVVLQNPFELRPTGGFIGLVCVVEVSRAEPRLLGCKPSEAYTAAAPVDDTMPFAYTQYLRLGGWYLRDANWSPDFPTTGRVLQEFWARNGGMAVDGVVAVDPYALVPLLQATGPLRLADGTTIDADHAVDALLTRYYNGTTYRNKSQLADLLPALLDHITHTDLPKLPAVAKAIQTSIAERHVLVAVNNPAVAAVLTDQGWDGAITPSSDQTVRVVDADVGYGAVNAFIERLTHYDVAMDDSGTPLTATLTLTYINHYSPWAEAATPYAVHGECTDPQTLQLERVSGCYANYLRVFVPYGSQLLAETGVEQTLGVDVQHGQMVFGGYLRVQPGEQRVVQVRYRLPAGTSSTIRIAKQPGTVAPPIMITAHNADHQALWSAAGRTDLVATVRGSATAVTIDGAGDQNAATSFASNAAFTNGLVAWQAGQHAGAISTWQHAGVIDRVLDYARSLAAQNPAEAHALLAALVPVATDGRAAFEQAEIAARQGDQDAADQGYAQAAKLSPEHPLALLMWGRRLAATDQPLPPMPAVSPTAAAVRRWRAQAQDLEQAGSSADALAAYAVLAHITPTDRALALHHADLRLRVGQRDQAATQYAALAAQNDVWGRLAAARQAQLADQLAAARTHYQQALLAATTYDVAFQIGDGLRDLGDVPGALRAYEQAASFAPRMIWPLLAAGNMLRGTDQAAAQVWFERAQQIDPTSGYPDFAIGSLLLEQNNLPVAIQYLRQAAKKQPEVQLFQQTLEQAQP